MNISPRKLLVEADEVHRLFDRLKLQLAGDDAFIPSCIFNFLLLSQVRRNQSEVDRRKAAAETAKSRETKSKKLISAAKVGGRKSRSGSSRSIQSRRHRHREEESKVTVFLESSE